MDNEKTAPALTGNDFIDAYNLGYQAGRDSRDTEVKEAEETRSRYYWEKVAAEKERDTMKELNAELRRRIKSLKKRLKGGTE